MCVSACTNEYVIKTGKSNLDNFWIKCNGAQWIFPWTPQTQLVNQFPKETQGSWKFRSSKDSSSQIHTCKQIDKVAIFIFTYQLKREKGWKGKKKNFQLGMKAHKQFIINFLLIKFSAKCWTGEAGKTFTPPHTVLDSWKVFVRKSWENRKFSQWKSDKRQYVYL